MKSLLKEKKLNLNPCVIVAVAITMACIAFTMLTFSGAFMRIWEAIKDFGISIAFWFCKGTLGSTDIVPTVSILPELAPGEVLPFLPVSSDVFALKMRMFGVSLLSGENALTFISTVIKYVVTIAYYCSFLLPIVLITVFAFKKSFYKPNTNHAEDTFFLKQFKKLSSITYQPLKRQVKGFYTFLQAYSWLPKLWLVIWLFNFNIITVVLEGLAFAFYFLASFDVANIYVQVYKLFLDTAPMFAFVPWWLFLPLILVVLHKMRVKIGYSRLNHMELKNRGFINSLPIVTMICGSMGVGKNNLEVDMALSQSAMFRQEALGGLLKIDMQFPNFPWITFEKIIECCIAEHFIYNLASCRAFVRDMAECFSENPTIDNCFGYDFNLYGFDYNDELTIADIWNKLETYAQLYFIYVIRTSLLVSNYSVREDGIQMSNGNFPLWNFDFFTRNPKYTALYSNHAHILDFDMLRLGKKVVENNPNAGALEFVILLMSEVGKERRNSLELNDVKKTDKTANQKNDLLNYWLKMCRHAASVDNFPFIKVFTDEQRPESWGADARDLCYIVTILNKSDTELAMPWFNIEELLYSLIHSKFKNLYLKMRNLRGDNTLLIHLLKTVVAKYENYYTRIYNRFGFKVMCLSTELGTQDGDKTLHDYYLILKKTFSKRYASDCFGDFFAEEALKADRGLADFAEYKTEKAELAELFSSNGYFMRDLASIHYKQDENSNDDDY